MVLKGDKSTTSYQCIPLTRDGKEQILEEKKQPQKTLILSPFLSFVFFFSSFVHTPMER